ncbi:MAG: hypothetical protein ACW99Q_25120 [Candidatus Kariarchaeaceae archaeon]
MHTYQYTSPHYWLTRLQRNTIYSYMAVVGREDPDVEIGVESKTIPARLSYTVRVDKLRSTLEAWFVDLMVLNQNYP